MDLVKILIYATAVFFMLALFFFKKWLGAREEAESAWGFARSYKGQLEEKSDTSIPDKLYAKIAELTQFIESNPTLELAWSWLTEAKAIENLHGAKLKEWKEHRDKLLLQIRDLEGKLSARDAALQLSAEQNAKLAEQNIALANRPRSSGRDDFAGD